MQRVDSAYSTRTLLSDLGTAEIFVVMLIRLRVAAHLDPDSVPEDWRAGMRAAGVSLAGADSFDLLMHLLNGVWRMPLDVRSLRCGGLGEGEALLLRCVSLLQESQFDAAEQLLGRWLPPGTSRVAAQQAQRFARALAQTRLCLIGNGGDTRVAAPVVSGRDVLPGRDEGVRMTAH